MSFLSAGSAFDQPSQILQSARYAGAFVQLVAGFDWGGRRFNSHAPGHRRELVVETCRRNPASSAKVRLRSNGLDSLDNPKLVGVVMNQACEFRVSHSDQYYGVKRRPAEELIIED